MEKCKTLKKILISSAALLMLASAGASASNLTNVNAKHVHTHRMARIHHHSHKRSHYSYYLRKYNHRRHAHKLNLKIYTHKHNVHKYNMRHHHARKSSLKRSKHLLSSNNSNYESKAAYKAGVKADDTYANGYGNGPYDFAKSKFFSNPQYLKGIYNSSLEGNNDPSSVKYANLVVYDTKDCHTFLNNSNFKHGWNDANNSAIDSNYANDSFYKRGWTDNSALISTGDNSINTATQNYNKAINGQDNGYYNVEGEYVPDGPTVY